MKNNKYIKAKMKENGKDYVLTEADLAELDLIKTKVINENSIMIYKFIPFLMWIIANAELKNKDGEYIYETIIGSSSYKEFKEVANFLIETSIEDVKDNQEKVVSKQQKA